MKESRLADLGAATVIEVVAASLLPEMRRAMLIARRRFEAMTQPEVARLIGESFSTTRTLNRIDEAAGRYPSALARMAAMTALLEVARANAELLEQRPMSNEIGAAAATEVRS